MEKIPRLTPEQRDNLVAYLDGELDEPTAREIEQTLTRSPVARNEVEMLTRTWELLDVLPKARASDEFTQRTLTGLQGLQEVREPWTEQPWFHKLRRGAVLAGWGAGLALSALFGFLATNRWIPNETETLVRDLPVIEQIEVYREVGSLEFLKQLQSSGVLDDARD